MIELILGERNELKFSLQVEGTRSPIKDVRLSLDMPDYKMSFKGSYKDGEVSFLIPNLKEVIKEGTYDYKLETLIEDHYFAPVEDKITFKKPITVSSAVVEVVKEMAVKSEPIVEKKTQPAIKVVAIEEPKEELVAEEEPSLPTPEPVKSQFEQNLYSKIKALVKG